MDFKIDQFDYEAELEKIREQVQKPNILILGPKGAGKSAVVARLFGRSAAPDAPHEPAGPGALSAAPAAGRMITKRIKRYDPPGLDVVLYDSEPADAPEQTKTEESYEAQIAAFVDERSQREEPRDRIHEAWYCIAATGKITDADVGAIDALREKGVPVAVLITQVDRSDAGALQALASEVASRLPGVPHFFVSTAADGESECAGVRLQWDELLGWAKGSLDAALAEGFVASLKGALRQKRSTARKSVVPKYAAAAATTGAIPIPFADATILVPLQVTMTMHVMRIFGLDRISGAVKQAVSSTVVSQLGRLVASTLTANLAKLIPIAGQYVGGAVNASVAAAFTSAMGYAVCELCYRYAYAVMIERRDLPVDDIFNPETIMEVYRQFADKKGK